jgi:hypothetical protein
MEESIERNKILGKEKWVHQQNAFREKWPACRDKLLSFQKVEGDKSARNALQKAVEQVAVKYEKDFISLIKEGLDENYMNQGILWLGSITNDLMGDVNKLVPV